MPSPSIGGRTRRPTGGCSTPPSFDAEPVVAWWQASPFVNVQPAHPDVRAGARRRRCSSSIRPAAARACADPPPAAPPAPTWTPATVAALSDPANTGTVAILTYGPTGQVTKIRLTRGC